MISLWLERKESFRERFFFFRKYLINYEYNDNRNIVGFDGNGKVTVRGVKDVFFYNMVNNVFELYLCFSVL